MATGPCFLTILKRPKIAFLALVLLSCHLVYGVDVKQSFQNSLATNLSVDSFEQTSEVSIQAPPKSILEISEPDHNTIWTVSETAKIEWKTENIDSSKSIRFFLAKDDMVVQELGSFENNTLAEGIELAKNVGSGDKYQVVGIELFPDNKFQVAKFATPYFSIRNPVADARTKAALAKRAETGKKTRTTSSGRSKRSSKQGDNSVISAKSSEKEVDSKAKDEFEGRKISYIKELSFANGDISVSLWDHGRQDGDIVSIYLNGEPVISKHLLTYSRKKVAFKLDPSKSNELFLYAHNLGEAPPNTVSIELTDGTTSEKIILNSDLKSCEAVQIKVKK